MSNVVLLVLIRVDLSDTEGIPDVGFVPQTRMKDTFHLRPTVYHMTNCPKKMNRFVIKKLINLHNKSVQLFEFVVIKTS
jgi:hypothetical protein